VAGRITIAGLVIAAFGPLTLGLLMRFRQLMPNCVLGGSVGPTEGCTLLGVSFDWLISWATPMLFISFFTVPIGAVIASAGMVGLIVRAARSGTRQ
jgi:hypothetical protein